MTKSQAIKQFNAARKDVNKAVRRAFSKRVFKEMGLDYEYDVDRYISTMFDEIYEELLFGERSEY